MVSHATTPWKWKIPLVAQIGARAGIVRAYALVDKADYEVVSRYPWRLNHTGYAVGHHNGRERALHRLLLGLEAGDPRWGDHVNRDRLDNRRVNLRIVTPGGNAQNRPSIGASRFRGVSHHPHGHWQTNVMIAGHQNKLGSYLCETTAALAAEAFRHTHMPLAARTPELARYEPVIVSGVLQCGVCLRTTAIRRARYWQTAAGVSTCDQCSGYLPPIKRRPRLPPRTCTTCGKPTTRPVAERCPTCWKYWHRNGVDRTPAMIRKTA